MIILWIMAIVSSVLTIGSTIIHVKEFFRLRNGCPKHEWEYHYIINDSCLRICKHCEIRQFRLSEDYFWGQE